MNLIISKTTVQIHEGWKVSVMMIASNVTQLANLYSEWGERFLTVPESIETVLIDDSASGDAAKAYARTSNSENIEILVWTRKSQNYTLEQLMLNEDVAKFVKTIKQGLKQDDYLDGINALIDDLPVN
jgi:hypothetical protein